MKNTLRVLATQIPFVQFNLGLGMIFNDPDISLDSVQKELVSILDSIAVNLSQKRRKTFLGRIICNLTGPRTASTTNSVYVYGGVGRGKTMIARAFYDSLIVPKAFIHYQDFMRDLHESMHKYKGEAMHDILVKLAKDRAKKYRFMCIDEFEVQDVADAMIIERFFRVLRESGTDVLLTSNIPPDQLYLNGLQREQFMPFIKAVKSEFLVFQLDKVHDYRLDQIESEKRVFYPPEDAKARIAAVKDTITDHLHFAPTSLEVFGRKLVFANTYKTVLVTSFDELCRQPLSSNDFIKIAKYFTTIIMEDVPCIGKDETDVVIRFINFIDNIYFYKVLLFISLAATPEEIYPEGRRAKEFQRTVSRLHEINSENYFVGSKHR